MDAGSSSNILKAIFKLILGGDETASEFAVLNLFSRIHTRSEGLVIGQLPLNLTNLDKLNYSDCTTIKSPAEAIKMLLTAICPFMLDLPLSIESLQTTSFASKKNYSTNKLE